MGWGGDGMKGCHIPSTGKSSNSSSSSSCAPGFCGASGWLVSFESVVRPGLVVGAFDWAAPDILGGVCLVYLSWRWSALVLVECCRGFVELGLFGGGLSCW